MTPLRAVTLVVVSLYLVTGGVYKGVKLYTQRKIERASATYYLCRILQTGPQREALKTTYLAELMQISADRPISFDQFSCSEAEKKLLSSPVIQAAAVKLIEPDTVYVDYTVRQPIASLVDFENTALDEQQVPFPITPFFTPKRLVQLHIGLDRISWKTPLSDERTKLALSVLHYVRKLPLDVMRIDVTYSQLESLGKREIVVIVNEGGVRHFLRLTPANYQQEITNYLGLRTELPTKTQLIDLRIPELAYISDSI